MNSELDVVILPGDALDDDVFDVPVGDGLVHSPEFCAVADRLKENLVGLFARFHPELLQLGPQGADYLV